MLNRKMSLFIEILLVQLCTITTMQKFETRIINGKPATLNATKHQVSIRLKSADTIFGQGHICGGSLITPKTVITAAHCIYNEDKKHFRKPKEFTIVMGTLNRFEHTNTTFIMSVKSFSYMKSFNTKDFKDDIALLHLKIGPAINQFNKSVETIKLNMMPVKSNTTCHITGWGITETNYLSAILLTANVTIADFNSCKLIYKPTPIMDGMLCAANYENSSDSCQGDSGGPLICNNQLAGIVSWGNSCAHPKYPGVYTDVQYYYQWIKQHSHSTRCSINCLLIYLVFMLVHYI